MSPVLILQKKILTHTSSEDMENGLDSKDCGPSDEEESDIWTKKEEEVLQDIASDEPLPEPKHHQSSMQSITILLQ